jgi:N-acetylmuramoyl-L-alanine amidase
MLLTGLADTLRGAGLDVVEVAGWRTRGHGEMTSVQTIVCHHTAGPPTGEVPSLATVRDGRPGLSGPLAQLMLGRSGRWYVVAAGKCYHAGVVLRASYANENAVGVEAEADGVSAWPAVQYHSYAKGCAALVKAYGLAVANVLGHKEVAFPRGRKSDPNFDMAAFRTLVAHYLEADVPLTDDDVNRVAQVASRLTIDGLLARVVTTGWQPDGTYDKTKPLQVTLGQVLTETRGASLAAKAGIADLQARPPAVGGTAVDVAALAQLLAPLLTPTLSAAEIADVIAARLAQ